MAILLKDLLKVSQRNVRIFNTITMQELEDKTSHLDDMVTKTQPCIDKYGCIKTHIYVKTLDDIKEEYVGKKYYSMVDHCVWAIVQVYTLSNDIYFTLENDDKDLRITSIDTLEEKIKNRIFQTPK